MRRKLITIAAVGLILTALCALEQIAVRVITRSALDTVRQIDDRISAGDYSAAIEKTHALDQTWDRQAKLLEMMVDHRSTDDVRYALSRLSAALESGDISAAMIYAGELEGGVEHVRERQVFTMENLL